VDKYNQEVCAEQRRNQDVIDEKVANRQKKIKVCPVCGHNEVPVRARKCGEVGKQRATGNRQAEPDEEVCASATIDSNNVVHLTYDRVDSQERSSFYRDTGVSDHHDSRPTTITQVLEPIFLNPNSYDTLAKIFRIIGKKSGIQQYCPNGERAWLAVVCDGSPFIIGIRLVRKYFLCPICDAPVVGRTECLSHVANFHPWEDNPLDLTFNFKSEFNWLLLLPGPGHIEMNMIKTFVKFTWPVFWEYLVEIFNFKSEAAKKAAMNVSDHHKGWSLCLIAFEACAKELIVPFIRSGPSEPSCAAFFKFVMFIL
jgi:hypothetical protein